MKWTVLLVLLSASPALTQDTKPVSTDDKFRILIAASIHDAELRNEALARWDDVVNAHGGVRKEAALLKLYGVDCCEAKVACMAWDMSRLRLGEKFLLEVHDLPFFIDWMLLSSPGDYRVFGSDATDAVAYAQVDSLADKLNETLGTTGGPLNRQEATASTVYKYYSVASLKAWASRQIQQSIANARWTPEESAQLEALLIKLADGTKPNAPSPSK